MKFSGSALILLPAAASAFDWSSWSSNTQSAPEVASAQVTSFAQPVPQTNTLAAVTFPAFNNNVAAATIPAATITSASVGSIGASTLNPPPTQIAPALTGRDFNLGVSTLCGKGPDGCGIITPARTIATPVPAPRIFGNDSSDDCDAFGKSGKSKGYNGNNPNCCGEGGKSKGYSSGSCGKSKGGKGKGGRSRTVNYEALASAAPAPSASSWTMVAVGASVVAVVSAMQW